MKEFSDILKNINNGTYLFFLGQAGFVIKNKAGKTLAIDLCLSDYTEKMEGHIGFKRLLPKLLNGDEIDINIIVATHGHADHFDVDAIGNLMRNDISRLVVSEGCKDLVKKLDIDDKRVVYVCPGDMYEYEGFCLHFVNCDHGTSAPDAVGIVVEVDGKMIYEAGDTCFRPDIAEQIKKQYSSLDVVIAPINGKFGNMNEEECAEYISILSPKMAVPCHYGMFASHGGDVGLFYDIMCKRYYNQDINLMAQGEMMVL